MKRLVAASLLCLGAFRFGAPSQTYRVIDLGVYHPPHSSSATSVNDLGVAVGTLGPGTLGFAFRWTQARGVEPLPGLAPTWVSSFRWSTAKVNNAGQVCGSQQPRVGYQSAFRFTPGTGYERLRPMPGQVVSEALGMNALGEVVGYSRGSSTVPTLWRPGRGPEFAGDLAFGIPTYANDINDQGLVAGMLTLHGTTDWRPYLWTPATGTRVLPVLPGRRYGTALAVNNLGVAAGYCTDFAFGDDGVIWKPDGTLVYAGDVSRTRATRHFAINDSGTVAGFAYNNVDVWGSLWTEGTGLQIVDALLDAEAILAGWHVTTCWDINSVGWVAAEGRLPDGSIRPIVLIPRD